ncbi:methyltransferase domain-containing protein [Terasakiella sp. A23]|uniref:class I SAM-dependent methyltransferase n=1 Tax=Terasakiella sp. FCG-A23 TaxID=3080561 RepID=UPI002952C6E1|nr:methyltransferase domain-containing protein [Terasakiella sp. A23]MDV7340067.1 methyltransferase domain-containing protein [Terasakiella sp. A23]
MQPSSWVTRFSNLIDGGSSVLDLACGGGRHGRLFLDKGCDVWFVDQNMGKLADLEGHAKARLVLKNLEEEGADWSFEDNAFDVIVVTNYLYRPHLADMLKSLKPDGVFIYETFGAGNEQFGRPRRADFLLQPGELLSVVQNRLSVVAYEHGIDGEKVVQRICAVKEGDKTAPYGLNV